MGADSLKICDDDDCILAWLMRRPRIISLSSAADLGGIHTSGFLVAELPGVPEVDNHLWAVGIGMGEGRATYCKLPGHSLSKRLIIDTYNGNSRQINLPTSPGS